MKISIQNLDFSYENKNTHQERCIFAQVNAEFQSGDMYAITGVSGVGKTTLFKLLARQLQFHNGEIKFDSHSINDFSIQKLRQEIISQVYQDYSLIPYMTVRENLLLSVEIAELKVRHSDEERAKELLAELDIEDKYDTLVSDLSGGEQQRVSIARALMLNPQVLLADEPTGALDKENSLLVGEKLHQLAHNRGIIVIVATHDLAIADIADKKYRIEDYSIIGG
ncbi:ATP-binding cassette domain-containing protein [Alloscardovia venturai]|uniref:ATP-binding cassette domain-containing protein n=1 Tax=Alloscardovia venturai TaxID=1769421 RepID=A0ABW2Y4U7_9BIFI